MSTQIQNVYVTTQGAVVNKDLGTIVVSVGKEVLCQVPIKEMRLLVLFGNIQVTTQAIAALLKEGIDIAFLTKSGHFKGKVVSAKTKNCFLRRDQHQHFSDPEKCLELAKKIIHAKHYNGIKLLLDYSYSGKSDFHFRNRSELEKMLGQILNAENLEQLLGYEGNAAKLYFEDYAQCFTGDLRFVGRAYYPSPDPVNALLSFGYSFIAREMQAILEAESLDPYIGFYHQLSYGRASLSLDLIEPFRHAFIDRLVLKLCNKNMLTADDFETQENGGVYLKRSSIAIFLKAFEESANNENVLYKNKEGVSFRKVFWQTVSLLKKTLQDNEEFTVWEDK